MKKFKFLKFLALFSALMVAIFLILDQIYPLNLDALKKDEAKILLDKNGEIINMKLSSDGIWRFHEQSFPNSLKQCVVLFEDRYFYYHFGVNFASIFRAFFHNIKSDNRIGASTITMQVARMLEPSDRSYKNKIREIFRAFQLELHFSKDEILNLYLNLAPYGGNIEGAKAASFFYFGKELNELSYAQAALLSTIPKNPNKNRLDRVSNINALKNRVIKMLYKANLIDLSAFKRAQAEPFKNVRIRAVVNASDYANVAFKNQISKASLDLNLQKDMLKILKDAMFSLKAKNANNAAAVVIDNKKMSVVAFIGSHDERARDGKNSALNMKRNTGSTLKPFIYSLALDSGLITPSSQLIDTQIYLNEYVPKNFSNDFLGLVSAKDALNFSLNIPVINLDLKLKDNSLYELLEKVNLVDENKEFYGSSIVLGSAEMSLLDLAHLYTIYANGGVYRPLEFAGKNYKNEDKNITLISPQSAYLTAKMMSEASRSYLKNAWQYAQNTPKIAFKTGTSANSRDLYAIGVDEDYTIAVWVGNFNAEKTDKLTGLNDVSKIVFDMFKITAQRQNLEFMSEPEGIEKVPTCLDAFSYETCKKTALDDRIVGVKLQDKCESLRGEELEFLIKNGFLDKDEVKNSPCAEVFKDKKPVFAYPYDGEEIVTDENVTQIMLKCYAFLGDEIYLKVDDLNFSKIENASEKRLDLTLGEHTLKCLDQNSNQSEITIKLRR
ncbi:Penicillin-insensitive transglycosylase & transpeptidase PBP-1C [Campylobacter concisus UNSWCS]|uniref:peptidoglycan glycosyltransferase n=1 Tax=Campylobacter concisus UNSWCS TaxID=1242968 RepID=U2FKD4_9BACT|nr:penicillin-binding protein 1C [Campylobacter concisus]ERJ30815.1 Penicillin-insensitive transglycosylase & transpeptidase PBP-1C [Campylobacter concisus UNSWCS]